MTHVSIVIIHFNDSAMTEQCLRSLGNIKAKSFRYTIVVVDNGSKDPFLLPDGMSNSKVVVIRSESNLGFTGGNNLGIHYGIEHYNSDYVLILNNDTVVDPSFLEHMLMTGRAEVSVGIICPKIYFFPKLEFYKKSYPKSEIGNVLWFAGGSVDWTHLTLFHRGVDEVDRGHFDSQTSTDFATGCAMLIKRELLEKIGTFDKQYFLYLEDADLSFRAKKAGYAIAFCPRSQVWHKNAGSSGGAGSDLHTYYLTRNIFLFVFKFGSLKQYVTAVRLLWRSISSGSEVQKQAVMAAITNQFGKRSVA